MTSPDANRNRTIHSYSIRLIDTWEIERTYQRQRQTAVSRFLHSRRWQDIYLYYLPRQHGSVSVYVSHGKQASLS